MDNCNDNPVRNSIIYDVEFPDGTVKEYSANPGRCHRSQGDPANAVSNSDKYIATRRGQRKLRKTTSEWKLLIRWKDDSESLIHLKD